MSVDVTPVDKPECMQQSSKDQKSFRISQGRGRPRGSPSFSQKY